MMFNDKNGSLPNMEDIWKKCPISCQHWFLLDCKWNTRALLTFIKKFQRETESSLRLGIRSLILSLMPDTCQELVISQINTLKNDKNVEEMKIVHITYWEPVRMILGIPINIYMESRKMVHIDLFPGQE